MNETPIIYKGYLRSLIRHFNTLKNAIDNNEIEKAKELIDELIEDTQKNIED